MAEAEVVRWLVRVGDRVELDQPVVEMQTDKAVVELPAPAAGRVTEIRWREGDTVPVGEVLSGDRRRVGRRRKGGSGKGRTARKAQGVAGSARPLPPSPVADGFRRLLPPAASPGSWAWTSRKSRGRAPRDG